MTHSLVVRATGCLAAYPLTSAYGYVPSLAAGITFLVLFGVLTLIVATRLRRHPWAWSVFMGGLLEVLGWVPRVLSHYDLCNKQWFSWQYAVLIIAPAFFAAGLYLLLGIAIQRSPENSAISPRSYLIIFCGADFISLVVQAVGGIIAAAADTDAQADKGADIIIGGILFQIVAMAFFNVLAVIFLRNVGGLSRLLPWKPATNAAGETLPFDRRLAWTAIAVDALIHMRNIYRCVELFEGWNGHLGRTERYVLALDAAPMTLCIGCFVALLLVAWREGDDMIDSDRRRMRVSKKTAASAGPQDDEEKYDSPGASVAALQAGGDRAGSVGTAQTAIEPQTQPWPIDGLKETR